MPIFMPVSLNCFNHCQSIKGHQDPSVSVHVCVFDPQNAETECLVLAASLEENHSRIHRITVDIYGMTPQLVQHFHRFLASSSSLESLCFDRRKECYRDLDDTQLIVVDRLLRSLAWNDSLTECSFGNTIVGLSSLAYFLRFAPSLKKLTLDTASVHYVHHEEAHEFALRCSTSSLVCIHLSGVSDLMRCMVNQMPASLQVLTLYDWCGGVAIGNAVRQCSLLQTLEFKLCHFLYDEWKALIAGLGETKSVTSIALEACVIPNAGGSPLDGQLLAARGLEHLTIFNCKGFQPDTQGHTFPQRDGTSTLRSLCLRQCIEGCDHCALRPIRGLPHLIRNMLNEQPQLERLYLSHCWTVQAITELAEGLATTKNSVRCLHFSIWNDDQHDTIKEILLSRGLCHFTKLQDLVLNFNRLGDRAVKALTNYLLSENDSANLRKLVIRCCRDRDSVTSILEAVQAKEKLEELEVSYLTMVSPACYFGSTAGFTRFLLALRGIRTLRTLVISGDRFPYESAGKCIDDTKAIVHALDANLSLQSFAYTRLRGDNSKLQSIGKRNRALANVDYGLRAHRYLWPHIVNLVLHSSVSMGPTIVFRMLTQHASTWNVK